MVLPAGERCEMLLVGKRGPRGEPGSASASWGELARIRDGVRDCFSRPRSG